jgi:quinol monooxygenase YgiN
LPHDIKQAPSQRRGTSWFRGKLELLPLQLFGSENVMAQEAPQPFVRLAELEIDPAQIETFNALVKEQITESVRAEPGVLALYAVAVKDFPSRVRVFEIYSDEAAYNAHLKAPHFKKFRTETDAIVTARKLIDTMPIILATKR